MRDKTIERTFLCMKARVRLSNLSEMRIYQFELTSQVRLVSIETKWKSSLPHCSRNC